MAESMIVVEVAYARPDQQVIIPVRVEAGTSVETAIKVSGILDRFADIDLTVNKVGIFSKACKLDQPVHAGDRVEIYRPLLIDPKESRRQRAAGDKKRAGGNTGA